VAPTEDANQAVHLQPQVELGMENAGQASGRPVNRTKRSEPLGFVFLGLVLFMIADYTRPQDWIHALNAVPLGKIIGIPTLLALAVLYPTVRWHKPRELPFLALLMIQLWLTVPFSPVWRAGAFGVMLDFSKVLPLLVTIYITVQSMKRLRWLLFVQAACFAVNAIISVAVARTSGGRLQGVPSGLYGNSNDFALVLDLSLPLALAFALSTKSIWKRCIWILAMLAMVYAVFLTASRGGTIALVVATLVCLWHFGVKNRRYMLLLLPIAMIGVWMFSGNSLRQRFDRMTVDPATNDQNADSASVQQRKELLLESLKVTAQHPLFGVGPGNFAVVSGVWRVTHNSYTQISAEGGIPALVLYLFFFGCGIANLRDIKEYAKRGKQINLFSMALAASLAAFFVGSFFGSAAYQLFPYSLVAYTGALRAIVERHRKALSLKLKSDHAAELQEVTV
jgi:putative inorganic carbon (hco3(-)) transporter